MIQGCSVQYFYSTNGRVEFSEFNKYDNINHEVPSCDHNMFCRSFESRMKTCTCNIKVRRRKLRGRYRAIWWWSDNYGMGQTQKLHSRYARVNSTEAMQGKMVKITSNIVGCILGLTQMHHAVSFALMRMCKCFLLRCQFLLLSYWPYTVKFGEHGPPCDLLSWPEISSVAHIKDSKLKRT